MRHDDIAVITEPKAWLEAFRALTGRLAVPSPSTASLRREALYADRR